MIVQFDAYLEDLGCFGSLTLSLFVLIALFMRLKETKGPKLHIHAMIAFFTINAFDMLDSLAWGAVFRGPSALYGWENLLIPGFMISVYFFVKGLTSPAPTWRPKDLLHLLPFAVAFLCLAPFLTLPGSVRAGGVPIGVSETQLALAELGETGFWVLWILVLLVYGTLCVRRLARHKRNIRDLFSDLEGKTLRWLDLLIATIFLLAGFVIVDEVRILGGAEDMRSGVVSLLYDLVLTGSFGLFALRADPPLPEWSHPVLERETASPSEDEVIPTNAPQQDALSEAPSTRYARSGLQAEDLDRFATRLEQRMRAEQLWRDHDLNLRSLATAIAISPIHLSEVLNTRLGATFYDYVNQCRIQDACTLLVQSDQTMLEISETVGFNAKSTFNASFRKITGQTPSQWRKSQKTAA